MSEIHFKIDGMDRIAKPGDTILKAATEAGIQIPTLCYNQKISKTTSCFVCVVKDKKTGKFLPSCSACPVEGQEIDASSEEVKEMRRTALGLLLSEHSGDCEAPCTMACPAHASVEEYVRAGKNGDFLKSLKIIKERIPLPMSIGRVCPRFCEQDCRRNIDSKPVSINDFKRLAADLHYESYMEDLPPLNGKKVAVIGAGPAGLSAAYYLRLQGFLPEIYEKMPEAGGMLRYGIPEFRLPKNTLKKELAHFEKMGITVRYGMTLGQNLDLNGLAKSYDAVILAVGSWSPSSMRIPGEEYAEQGIRWLGNIAEHHWKNLPNPGTTLVVGGGNTAMDCARTAIRLGGNVTVVYRRTRKEMPAQAVEVDEAVEEGVNLELLTAPVALKKLENGKLSLSCCKMQLGEPDASGRRKPEPVPDSEFELIADTVIAAIGQKTVCPQGLTPTRRGDIETSPEDLKVSGQVNIFAAGDCVSGPATVVEAVAAGRKAAIAAMDYISGIPHTEPPVFNVSRGHWSSLSTDDLVFLHEVSKEERVQPEFIPLEQRKTTFTELFPTISADKIRKEGERCIECSCTAKGECKLKKHSEALGVKPDMFKGEHTCGAADTRHPAIIQDPRKCLRCGICVKICSEVVNQHLLAVMQRGFAAKIGTAFGKGLPLSCKDCGKCIRECPVGALDWKIKE